MKKVEEIRDVKVNNNNNNKESNDHHRSNSGIIMITEQETPLGTYDDMVQEMEQEIIIHEDTEIIEETPGTLDVYFRMADDNKKDTQRDSVLD